MDLEGSIKVIFDKQTFNSGFQKREFVVTTKEQYPQDVKFELVMDRIDLIDPYKPGDELKVHFNIRGNEYNGKYFVNLQAWRLEPLGGTPEGEGNPARDPFADAPDPETEPFGNSESENTEDDLPF